MTHLLVTNDFPPKVGGIQSHLWELWRRLPPDDFAVLTIEHPGSAEFDRAAGFRIERLPVRMLRPGPALVSAVSRLAGEIGAGLVVLDPALPAGLIGPWLRRPYALVLHGAEVTVPARLPALRSLLARTLSGAQLLVAAGGYPLAEARRTLATAHRQAAGRRVPAAPASGAPASPAPASRDVATGERSSRRDADSGMPPSVVLPPGVDLERFHPLDAAGRASARARLGLPASALVVSGVSRLVPRKGFDVLIEASAALAGELPTLLCVIAGTGRDAGRLASLARTHRAPVRFLGHVSDDVLPLLYGCSDVFAMLCRTRWLGLEQEGYGIVFNEASASGVASLAGASGGSPEAVLDGETGVVLERPGDARLAGAALRGLLLDEEHRARLGAAARRRAETEMSWDVLASRLGEALAAAGG